MKKPAKTQESIDDIIANRWSPVGFDMNKTLTQAQIVSLLEAARWAPSCFGDQPWRFIVSDKASHQAAWQKAYECLVPGNQKWAENAPLLVLVCTDTQFSHNDKPNRWAGYDAGAAAVSLCLQATSMGLVTHQMGGFDVAKARDVFAIPEQYDLMSMIAVGYGVDVETLPDDLKERQMKERSRHPLGQIFFNGVWNKPII
jgi:nitroreductase